MAFARPPTSSSHARSDGSSLASHATDLSTCSSKTDRSHTYAQMNAEKSARHKAKKIAERQQRLQARHLRPDDEIDVSQENLAFVHSHDDLKGRPYIFDPSRPTTIKGSTTASVRSSTSTLPDVPSPIPSPRPAEGGAKYCMECGAEMVPNSRFCMECGSASGDHYVPVKGKQRQQVQDESPQTFVVPHRKENVQYVHNIQPNDRDDGASTECQYCGRIVLSHIYPRHRQICSDLHRASVAQQNNYEPQPYDQDPEQEQGDFADADNDGGEGCPYCNEPVEGPEGQYHIYLCRKAAEGQQKAASRRPFR